jgi:hypothetical protein
MGAGVACSDQPRDPALRSRNQAGDRQISSAERAPLVAAVAIVETRADLDGSGEISVNLEARSSRALRPMSPSDRLAAPLGARLLSRAGSAGEDLRGCFLEPVGRPLEGSERLLVAGGGAAEQAGVLGGLGGLGERDPVDRRSGGEEVEGA